MKPVPCYRGEKSVLQHGVKAERASERLLGACLPFSSAVPVHACTLAYPSPIPIRAPHDTEAWRVAGEAKMLGFPKYPCARKYARIYPDYRI